MSQTLSESYWMPNGTLCHQNENEVYVSILCGHLHNMTERLRLLPADLWDWTPDVAAPTARILASHTWQWLICDRQHILEPDALRHELIPDPPADPAAMCDELAEETARWKTLLLSLTPEQFDSPRCQFDYPGLNVRWFVSHMIQNSIYKHGQFTTLFFALGLDGKEPYDAPFPNPVYKELRNGSLS
ncbi:MAG: DinB family protein [Capsulimonas sp.]|uniref:DinB family protein n=1 Tax=Capsulimonas sp. TaxID=2494211 RepID=UPI003264CEEA